MPAVIGLVFVFLVGVVVWVIASSGDGDDDAAPIGPQITSGATSTEQPTTSGGGTAAATSPPTTSPTPLPSTSPAPSTTPTTAPPTTPTTSPPVTAAPGAGDDAVPGDLGIPGRAMLRPSCDGSFITVLASPIGDQATAAGVEAVLEQYPGSSYLRTDQTCPSLNPSSDGRPIYVIFLGPFAFDSDACTARSEGPEGAYARQLSDEVGPDHSVTCA